MKVKFLPVSLPRGLRAFFYSGLGMLTREVVESISDEVAAFERVSLIRRAVGLRQTLIASLPYALEAGDGRSPSWEDLGLGISLPELLARMELDLLLFGASYFLKIRMASGRIAGLQHLPPDTVTFQVDDRDPLNPVITFEQVVGGQKAGPWAEEDMLYAWEENPAGRIGPGKSALYTVLSSASVWWAMREWANLFFRQGAMPVTIVSFERPVPGVNAERERERIEGWFRRVFTRLRNAWRVVAIQRDVKVHTLSPDPADLALPELSAEVIRDVSIALGIPEALLTQPVNYATAQVHQQSLYTETILPRARWLVDILNRRLLQELGVELIVSEQAIPVLQEEEKERASALQALVAAGAPFALALEMLGMDLPPGWDVVDGQVVYVGQPVEAKALPRKDGDLEDVLDEWERLALARVRRMGHVGRVPLPVREKMPPVLVEAVQGALSAVQSEEDVEFVFFLLREGLKSAQALRAADDVEKALARKLGKVEYTFFRRLRDLLGSPPDPLNVPPSYWEEFAQAVNQVLTSELVDYMVEEAAEFLAQAPLGLEWDDFVQQVTAYSRQEIAKWADSIVSNTRRTVEQVLADLLETGWDEKEFMRRLALRYGPVHAEMVAVTEVTRAGSAVAEFLQENLRKQGIRTVRRWLTAEDERVCPVCAPLDHTTDDSGAWPSPSGPPAHVRCRCRVAVEWRKGAGNGRKSLHS